MEREGGAFKDDFAVKPVSRSLIGRYRCLNTALLLVKLAEAPCRKIGHLANVAHELYILPQKHTFFLGEE